MTWKHRTLACSSLALVLAAWTSYGQQQEKPSTGQRVSEKLDSAVQSLKRGAKGAGETIHQQYARARTAVHNMGVSGRVYARLHWDKALQNAKIDLDVKENGVATLVGTVPDAKAKLKALELTQDTVGVVRVVDRLNVQTPETPNPAAATPATPNNP